MPDTIKARQRNRKRKRKYKLTYKLQKGCLRQHQGDRGCSAGAEAGHRTLYYLTALALTAATQTLAYYILIPIVTYSLYVDFPKPGFGSSNYRNTSKRFFANPEVAAAITGIGIELIKRFSVILEVMSSGLKINTQKFGDFYIETARLYVVFYPWQPMAPTVHKILVHVPEH